MIQNAKECIRQFCGEWLGFEDDEEMMKVMKLRVSRWSKDEIVCKVSVFLDQSWRSGDINSFMLIPKKEQLFQMFRTLGRVHSLINYQTNKFPQIQSQRKSHALIQIQPNLNCRDKENRNWGNEPI